MWRYIFYVHFLFIYFFVSISLANKNVNEKSELTPQSTPTRLLLIHPHPEYSRWPTSSGFFSVIIVIHPSTDDEVPDFWSSVAVRQRKNSPDEAGMHGSRWHERENQSFVKPDKKIKNALLFSSHREATSRVRYKFYGFIYGPGSFESRDVPSVVFKCTSGYHRCNSFLCDFSTRFFTHSYWCILVKNITQRFITNDDSVLFLSYLFMCTLRFRSFFYPFLS